MSSRTHVLLAVGWGALALLVLFGGLALAVELPGWLVTMLVGSVMAVPTYLARSPLTPRPAPVGSEPEPATAESNEALPR